MKTKPGPTRTRGSAAKVTATKAKRNAPAEAPLPPPTKAVAAGAAARLKQAAALRRRAETSVRAAPAKGKATSGAEQLRLLHELQVHQVELEMQNDELRRTNDELSALHERYQTLYDFAPVAYFTVDADRRIVELNLAAARLLRHERRDIPGKRLVDFVHARSRQDFEALLDRALAGSELVEHAVLLQPPGAEPLYVKMQGRHAEGPEGLPQVSLVLVDLTALKSANDELARALEQFFRYWRP